MKLACPFRFIFSDSQRIIMRFNIAVLLTFSTLTNAKTDYTEAANITYKYLGLRLQDKEVCFNRLGCFSLEPPWQSILRPIPAPYTPEEINTRVYFYSRPNTSKRREILLRPNVNLNNAPLDREKLTTIIIHGFASNGNNTWVLKMKDALLKVVNMNVMIIDWGPGASLLNYLQVCGNARVVGREIARFVNALKIDPIKLYLIGHSLGSHIAAYAANGIPHLARITALDPAQPAFEGFDKKVRIDETDATFVDVIHTDARPIIPTLGLGMITKAGHVDFYMNGGFDQPGCSFPDPTRLPKITSLLDFARIPVEVLADIVTCPHERAYEFFIESMNMSAGCVFWGHKASITTIGKTILNTLSQGVLHKLVGLTSSCSRTNCTPMGLYTTSSPLRGCFVVTTKGRPPFCIK